MIASDLHILTENEIIEKLYSMEVITGKDYPMRLLSFIVPNKNYDTESFSQEIEDSENDYTYEDTINIIKGAELFFSKKVDRRNSQEWLDNHSKICKVTIIPMALLIQAERHENGRRDFCTEENVHKIMNLAEQYGGIVKMM